MKRRPVHVDEVARRQFLRWSSLAALALGVERVRYLEVLDGLGGDALAQAATPKTLKSLHFIGGFGGLANFTLPFPHPYSAKTNDDSLALHEPGRGVLSDKSDNELYYVEGSPFRNAPKRHQISAYLCGLSGAHNTEPFSVVNGNTTLLAACAAIQADTPAILPSLIINGRSNNRVRAYGAAAGAPSPAVVANVNGIAELFNSRASQLLLSTARNAKAGEHLGEMHTALLALSKASKSSTSMRARDSSRTSLALLGQVLAERIRPTPQQLAMYGHDDTNNENIRSLIRGTASALNAMGLGLLRMMVLPAVEDDPHGMFGGGNTRARNTSIALGRFFDGLLLHGATIQDPDTPSQKLIDQLVFTITGDLMKNPFTRGDWSDAVPMNSHVMYAWGQQYLKKGWFGGFRDSRDPVGFDPANGQSIPYARERQNPALASAAAAVLYAISAGTPRRIDKFIGNVEYKGLINPASVQ